MLNKIRSLKSTAKEKMKKIEKTIHAKYFLTYYLPINKYGKIKK